MPRKLGSPEFSRIKPSPNGWNGAKRFNFWNDWNKSLQRFSIGSKPLLVIAPAASGEARNLTVALAASESPVLRATPAEKTETFCTSGGNGVT